MNKLFYHVEPELEEMTTYECGIDDCGSCLIFNDGAHLYLPCAIHGFKWIKVIRQFENGIMISEFKESLV